MSLTGPDRRVVVLVAHGTRTRTGTPSGASDGNEVARDLARLAGERLGLPALAAYVELAEPLIADVAPDLPRGSVAVPLLLSTGLHVRTDVPEATAGTGVRAGRALGPHALLARAQAARLREAGGRPGDPVVLASAGSTDPGAATHLARARDLLAREWGGDVRAAVLGGDGPPFADVVRPGDLVSPYLVAPGFFSRRLAGLAAEHGAVAAGVLGTHEAVVELIVRRARVLLDLPAPD